MKLMISEMSAWGRYVSREFYYVMANLINNYGWNQIDTFELYRQPESLRTRLTRMFGQMPEVILFWEGYDLFPTIIRELIDLDCRKCILADDLNWRDESVRSTKHLAYTFCDVILSTYDYVFDRFYPGLRATKEIVWVPHAASPQFMLPYNTNPVNAILLSGMINDSYPFRQRMKTLYDRRRYPIVLHEHPGYRCDFDYDRDDNVGSGYAQTINRVRAAFTDCLTHGYLVAKHFEIPATGSALLADTAMTEPLRSLGFEEYVHYIPVAPKDIEAQIQYVVDPANRLEVDEIRRRGQELVWARHKTSDRAALIDRSCGLQKREYF